MIEVRLGNVAGQVSTLLQLGNLYGDVLHRPEEAADFYRQAADKYVVTGDTANEGRARSNLGSTLRKLRRFDEARQEIYRAVECKAQFGHASEPWTTWHILADIETEANNPAAAAQAQRKAIASYGAYRLAGGENHDGPGRLSLDVTQALLAGNPDAATAAQRKAIVGYFEYRRDGGENHDGPGRLSLAVTQPLLAGDPAQAASRLGQFAANPEAAWLLPFIRALQAIVNGSRDPSLADAPDLHYGMAAEILLLIETLCSAGR